MKYEPPYGSPGSNDPYINGNPATGTMGSIPPAASIENPQREIVNLIADAGLTPTDSDLHQLGEAIQSGQLFYGDDMGTPNNVVITLKPVPPAYIKGMVVVTKIGVGNNNTGAATINVNGLGAKSITYPAGTPLLPNAYVGGGIQAFAYDGAKFQLAWPGNTTVTGGGGGPPPDGGHDPIFLLAPRDYYVATTGSDTANDGLTLATPFKTIQHALAIAATFNQNGFDVTVHVADGAYTGPVFCKQNNGQGKISIIGNTANPAACSVAGNPGSAFRFAGVYTIQGFYVSGTVSGADTGCGFAAGATSVVTVANCLIGSCSDYAFLATGNANIGILGTIQVGGSMQGVMLCWGPGSLIIVDASNSYLTISPPLYVANSFAQAYDLGGVLGHFTTITNYGSVSGRKFSVSANAIIDSQGAGVNYWPGTIPGATSYGGEYV